MSDLEKIKSEKCKLERQISEMIIKFEVEHRVSIEEINIHNSVVMGKVFPKTAAIKIVI